MDRYVALFVLIILFLVNKSQWLSHILFILTISTLCILSFVFHVNAIIHFFAGILISIILLNITYFISYGNLIFRGFKLLSFVELIQILMEEIVWRQVLFNNLINTNVPFAVVILLALLNSILFTIWHKDIIVKEFFEMSLFTVFLCLSSYFFPYMNFGIHIGRNSIIQKVLEGHKYENK